MAVFATHEDYRRAWAEAYKSDPPVPLNIDIELASLCNLACPFCFWGEAKFQEEMLKASSDGKAKKRLMPTDLAIQLIDEAAKIGVPALKFNWRGESTLHPEYSRILQHARFRPRPTNGTAPLAGGDGYLPAFYELLVNTNANCKDRAVDGLMAATKVMISLDSTIPEIYAQMRVNGRLERALEVSRELIRRKHPNLWIRRVITKVNRDEPFAENVRRILGPDGYKVAQHYAVNRSKDQDHQMDNPESYERTYCGYPSQRIMVAADGTCFPCCVDTDGTMPMGVFNGGNLLEIWNGEEFRKLRADLRQNKLTSEICKRCESWMAYKAPQRQFVQDKAV